MKQFGNILIFVGALIWLAFVVSIILAFLLSLLFGCEGGFTSEVECVIHIPLVAIVISLTAGLVMVGSFIIAPLTVPIFVVGFLFKVIAKKFFPATYHQETLLDTINKKLLNFIISFILVVLAISFWFVTLAILVFYTFKYKSISAAVKKFVSLIFADFKQHL